MLRTSRSARPALRACLLVCFAGCSDDTSILVEVTSDLGIPAEVDALEIEVVGDAAGSMIQRSYELSSGWPHTISLRPGRVESQAITIAATVRSGGAFVARRAVRSRFVSGEQVSVRIHIPASCRGVMCAATEDCDDGRCVPLESFDGGRDAGSRDGGTYDAPASDGGCASPAECDDGVACTLDLCSDGACQNEPDHARCREGSMCDPVMGCPPIVCGTDPECADGVSCNGVETCVDMVCAPGTTVDCNDGDGCTSDRCDESMGGRCAHSTTDSDSDGFGDATCTESGGVPATDCNDANPDVFPGSPEVCNGVDDDCAMGCDDGFTCCRGETGSCTTTCGTTGMRTCGAACGWSVCAAPPETCNGLDDDCNDAPDDVFACVRDASEACTTTCGSTGSRTCAGDCTWSACTAPDETCNGRDDDCDSRVDETFGCAMGTTMSCATTCGSTGSRACGGTCTFGACTPPAEGCNGRDDDCDTRVDETVECTSGTTGACTTTCGSTGSRSCSAMCMWGTCSPPAETCNGSDDDCDGRVDETFTCVPGSTGSCTTGCMTTGSRTCTAMCTWGTCTPPTETCNGRDEDCDMMCDEIFTCCAGSTGSCTTSCGTTGSRTCSPACGWSACSPPAETCNGNDDDCNSVCDDGFTCCAGRSSSCTTTCGTTGSRTCSAACAFGACTPPIETCNAGDDDCDSRIDESFACVMGASGSCTTTCGSMGTRVCSGTCAWGTCTPPVESCNGADDDCDGMTDEGCGVCAGCAGAVGVAPPGGRFIVPFGASAHTGSCGGGGGSEGHLTFTTTAVTDVFITTHHAGTIDTVVYVRDCSCMGTERACNDNADGRNTSVLRLSSIPAGTYNIVVDTKVATSGTVPVDVYITAPGAASDRCGNPTFIPAATAMITGDTCAFSSDETAAVDLSCDYTGIGGAEDRVFYFYLPTSRAVTFNGCTTPTDYDTSIYVRDVCTNPAAASQLACNDDGCGGIFDCGGLYRSSLTATLGPGLFYVFADGYDSADCPCGSYRYDLTGL